MSLFDTHAHLDDPQLAEDVVGIIERAMAAGVGEILAVGTTLPSSRQCVDIAQQNPNIYAAVGIHPNHSHEAAESDWDDTVALAREAKVVALGETGLDKHWDFAPLALQQDYFDRHLRLSQATRLPVVIHVRDSMPEVLAMLHEARLRGPIAGIMHSFTGNAAEAAECLELGLYLSFAGMVTFKKSDELRSVAAAVPADRILVETDSPYLSPEPVRGKRPNEPARVRHTAECLAKLRALPLADFARQTTENARRLLQIAI
jgi:TatD DNase family protein